MKDDAGILVHGHDDVEDAVVYHIIDCLFRLLMCLHNVLEIGTCKGQSQEKILDGAKY